MSTYRKVRAETAAKLADPKPADPGDELLSCAFCGAQTKRRVLSTLGARCEPCYAQYIQLGYSGQEPLPRTPSAKWVKAAAAKAREAREARGVVNPFAALAERLKARRGALPSDASEDEINAMAQEATS